jgi:hypothetical protein
MRCATRPPIRDAFGGVSPFGRRRVRRQHDVLSRGLSFQPLNLRGKVAGAPTLSRAPARAKGRPGAGSSSGGLTSSDPLPADLAAARAMILRRADGATRSRVAGAARRGSDARGLSGSEYVSSAPRMLWRRGRDLDQAAAWRADPDVRYRRPGGVLVRCGFPAGDGSGPERWAPVAGEPGFSSVQRVRALFPLPERKSFKPSPPPASSNRLNYRASHIRTKMAVVRLCRRK